MNKKPTHKEVESELEEIISGGKPKIIAARLPSMPIPDYIDRHLRGKNIKYLWNLTPIKDSPIETDNGMYLGVWMNKELDYVHMIIASKDVLDFYMNISEYL